MEIVGIYVNGRTFGRALMHDDSLEPALAPRGSRPPHPSVRQTCEHSRQALGFAYRRSRDEHWPVAFCEDCLTILAGLDPLGRSSRPRWKRDEREAAAARWSREWPKPGRPRASRPSPATAWPEAA